MGAEGFRVNCVYTVAVFFYLLFKILHLKYLDFDYYYPSDSRKTYDFCFRHNDMGVEILCNYGRINYCINIL